MNPDDLEVVAKAGYETKHVGANWEEAKAKGVDGPWREAANRVHSLAKALGSSMIEGAGKYAYAGFTAGVKEWADLKESEQASWKNAGEVMFGRCKEILNLA